MDILRGRQQTKAPRIKGAGRSIIYWVDKDEQLLVWHLDAHDKQLPITTQNLEAKA